MTDSQAQLLANMVLKHTTTGMMPPGKRQAASMNGATSKSSSSSSSSSSVSTASDAINSGGSSSSSGLSGLSGLSSSISSSSSKLQRPPLLVIPDANSSSLVHAPMVPLTPRTNKRLAYQQKTSIRYVDGHVNKRAQCLACHSVPLPLEAVQTPCHHLFCRGCIVGLSDINRTKNDEAAENGEPRTEFVCPNCKSVLGVEARSLPRIQTANPMLYEMMYAVDLCCPIGFDQGCKWTGAAEMVDSHMYADCVYRAVKCEYCDEYVPMADMEIHHETKCAQQVPCTRKNLFIY